MESRQKSSNQIMQIHHVNTLSAEELSGSVGSEVGRSVHNDL